MKKLKSVKKVWKSDPPLKKAKMSDKWAKSTLCEIRAAWSGVFWVPGGTTGPGFKAENDPLISLCEKWHTFCIYHFYDLLILRILVIFDLCIFDHFGEIDILGCAWLHYNKALLVYTGEEMWCNVVVLPSFRFFVADCF